MKLRCHRPTLVTAFQIAGAVVPSRTPKEILRNVKIQVADGKAILIATDQEIGVRCEIPGVEIESTGEALLPAARVTSILRELQDDSVFIELADSAAWIRSGQSEFRLSIEDPAEFPPVSDFEEEKYHIVPGKAFKEAVKRTIFATDVESTRYALGGVLLELDKDSVTLAATDSRRLAVVKTQCRAQGLEKPENPAPVIPSKAMSLIERSISDDSEVYIAVQRNDVLVKCGQMTIYSRLVEGRFPKYRDVIPAQSKISIELLAGPFLAAVRQAQIVTSEESRGVDFAFSPGLLTLNSQAADIGQSKVELPIAYDGAKLEITFDPRFVSDFLRVLEPEKQIRLELIDSESAAVLRTDDAYTYVIMPLSRDR